MSKRGLLRPSNDCLIQENRTNERSIVFQCKLVAKKQCIGLPVFVPIDSSNNSIDGDWVTVVVIHTGQERVLFTGRAKLLRNEEPTDPPRVVPHEDAHRVYYRDERLCIYLSSHQKLDPANTTIEIPYHDES